MQEAILYNKLKNGKVQCRLCNHFCLISSNKVGRCGVRRNDNGTLLVLNYGTIIAKHIDPIVKKPIYDYLCNTETYSIAMAGCNFTCLHCQNADISQIPQINDADLLTAERNADLRSGSKRENAELIGKSIPETTPSSVVAEAIENNCPSISYTYTEPTIFVEFALECMKLTHNSEKDPALSACGAKGRGSHFARKNIWVSNGYMSPECLKVIIPYLDAINVDLKFFTEKSYQDICGAKLQPVLDNLIEIKKQGVHLEITTLIIPDVNDSDQELKSIADFIHDQLSPDTPWHISAFHPTHKMMDKSPTPTKTILRTQRLGQEAGLHRVYPGNIT